MKLYKIPKLEKHDYESPPLRVEGKESRHPKVYVPITSEFSTIKVGGGTTVTLKGKVCEVRLVDENKEYSHSELILEVEEVGVEANNEFSELADHEG